MRVSLLVLAKAPAPGRSKTRLCPPCTPTEAAHLAEAALRDTLEAVVATPAYRHLLVLDGDPGDFVPDGFEVVSQRGDGLDERLAAAFADAGGPAVLVGMDTPQLTPALLVDAVRSLEAGSTDALLGPAVDGGYWAVGLREPDPTVFLGVPMSTPGTLAAQWERLVALGREVGRLPMLRDVDVIDDAWAVAEEAPGSRFAAALVETFASRSAAAAP